MMIIDCCVYPLALFGSLRYLNSTNPKENECSEADTAYKGKLELSLNLNVKLRSPLPLNELDSGNAKLHISCSSFACKQFSG